MLNKIKKLRNCTAAPSRHSSTELQLSAPRRRHDDVDRDYYLRDSAEFPGEWHGRGAEMLGLSGQVDKESYFRLCDNLDPRTGEPLTPRTKADSKLPTEM